MSEGWTAIEEELEGVKLPDGQGRVRVTLMVNGRSRTLQVRSTATLLDALRDQLGLFGARSGCGVGMCGACAVIRDGSAVAGCLTLASLCDGSEVRTVEGLGGGLEGGMSRVQEAFLRHRAFQCSYCTSGFILALEALLASGEEPTEAAVLEAFSGHICRCGSYSRIMAAALEVAAAARNDEAPEAQA